MDSAKRELLNKTLKDINKRFGANTAMCMDSKTIQKIDVISTGSYLIDRAIGVGGIPRGRIIEVFGPESAGKTTLALHVIAQCQKAGGAAVMVDVEHALDPNYAKALGVDIDELIISQPDCGEDALEVTEALVRSGTIDLVVVDSVAALVPKAEIEGEMGDAFVGLHARLMSKALRKLVACVNETKTSIIFINQLREKVGVMYGNPEVTTGGRALKFYSSLRIEVRKTETLKKGTEQYGHKLKVKIVKNKLAPPFKETEVTVLWGKGIDATCEILDLAIETNIIDKSGAWFTYDEQRFQGKEKVSNFFEENPAEFDILRNKVVSVLEGKDSKVNPIKDVEAVVDPEEDVLGDLED